MAYICVSGGGVGNGSAKAARLATVLVGDTCGDELAMLVPTFATCEVVRPVP